MSAFRIAVLASGVGTNLQAILDGVHGDGDVEVVAVASNRQGAKALERAATASVEAGVFPAEEFPDRRARDLAMADWLDEREVDLVVLAGYMELLEPEFVGRFRDRVINVHPALLPSFPGLDPIERALRHGVKVTGVTVHYVDEGMDSGAIVLQRAVEIDRDAGVGALEKRIHAVEHELLPRAIRLIAAGRVRIDRDNPRLVHVDASDGDDG